MGMGIWGMKGGKDSSFKALLEGSILKGKNLLLEEQILSFENRSQLRREENLEMAEFLSWKIYPCS